VSVYVAPVEATISALEDDLDAIGQCADRLNHTMVKLEELLTSLVPGFKPVPPIDSFEPVSIEEIRTPRKST
jgi:hypothetical protein